MSTELTQLQIWISILFVLVTFASNLDCNLLRSTADGEFSYKDTESETAILSMCDNHISNLSLWEQYQCEYIKNRYKRLICWPQRRMSHCAPGQLKGVLWLYHGFSACPNYYNDIAAKLQEECWHIYQMTTVGHGYNYCNSTRSISSSCVHGSYNLTNLPNSHDQYTDFVKMMNGIMDDEVSVIKQCEFNANAVFRSHSLEVAIGGLSFGATLAAYNVLISNENHHKFTKQLLLSPQFGLNLRHFDTYIYKCLLNKESLMLCLPRYFAAVGLHWNASQVQTQQFMDAIERRYDIDLELLNTYNEIFSIFVAEIFTTATETISWFGDVINTWDYSEECQNEVMYHERGGFCSFTLRHLGVGYRFTQFVVELNRGQLTQFNTQTLLILAEKDNPIWNSYAVSYVKIFYANDHNMIHSKTDNCMWLVDQKCKQNISINTDDDEDNRCTVPHSFMTVAGNIGIKPYYLYWKETYLNGITAWLNNEQQFGDNFMVDMSGWDLSRNQCVQLDLIDPPRDLISYLRETADDKVRKIYRKLRYDDIKYITHTILQHIDVDSVLDLFTYSFVHIVSQSNVYPSMMNVSMTFKCPTGEIFTYDQGIVVEQAYNACPKPCPEQLWTEHNVPVLFDDFVLFEFGDACDIHHMCYVVPGVNKRNCDEWFYDNMLEICAQKYCVHGTDICNACNVTATVFYLSTVVAGQSYYINAQTVGSVVMECVDVSNGMSVKVIDLKGYLQEGQSISDTVNAISHVYKIHLRSSQRAKFEFCVGWDGQINLLWISPLGHSLKQCYSCECWIEASDGTGDYIAIVEDDVWYGNATYTLKFVPLENAQNIQLLWITLLLLISIGALSANIMFQLTRIFKPNQK